MLYNTFLKRNGLHSYKFLYSLLGIATMAATCFSTSVSINTDSIYSGGVITYSNVPESSYNYDTIKFTNSVTLFFYDQTSPIPEFTLLACGVAVAKGTDIIKKGFKFLPGVSWKKSSIDATIAFYPSNDTLWELSTHFPDSLVVLDSLYDCDSPDHCKNPERGKWFYFPNFSGLHYFADPIENFNTIIYIHTKKNKIKIQVHSLYINFPPSMYVDSMKIFWATDSCGNGKFLPSTAIDKNNKKPSTKIPPGPAYRPDFGNGSLTARKRGEAISVFDIQGRRSPSISGRLSTGVFLLKTDNGRTAAVSVVRWR